MALTKVEELLVDMLKYHCKLGPREISVALYALPNPQKQLDFMKWIMREAPDKDTVLQAVIDMQLK